MNRILCVSQSNLHSKLDSNLHFRIRKPLPVSGEFYRRASTGEPGVNGYTYAMNVTRIPARPQGEAVKEDIAKDVAFVSYHWSRCCDNMLWASIIFP